MTGLAKKRCIPCRGGTPALTADECRLLAAELGPKWEAVNGHHLRRTFQFENFREALDFTNRIGDIAEEQKHHPDVHLSWGKVTVEIWTHKIDGLTESDFILAAKCSVAATVKRDV